ncbi:MAG: hypothetical protein FJ405_01090 [Verrucomicrobia bacterium]|nr:hypothetical protein [Verrucomicrobiota bacterium]
MASVQPLLHPLDESCARAGRRIPSAKALQPEDMPEPYRSLLVHDTDMTSTLSAFHGNRLHLEVLSVELGGDACLREVVLRVDGTRKPVEFGAIKIHLHALPPPARRLVLEGRVPLGQILRDAQIPFLSKPKGYLKVVADEFMSAALELKDSKAELFGRRNTLTDPRLGPIAEIVEILPPAVASTHD